MASSGSASDRAECARPGSSCGDGGSASRSRVRGVRWQRPLVNLSAGRHKLVGDAQKIRVNYLAQTVIRHVVYTRQSDMTSMCIDEA